MSSKLILNTNPVVVLQEFEKTVKQGYLFVPGRSDLFIHSTGLMELELFKQQLEIPKLSFEEALDKVSVHSHDKTDFLLQLQKYILSGWELDLRTVYFDTIGSKMCRVVHKSHPISLAYTKEQLQEMEYDELKRVAKLRNCFVKSRDVMVSKILQFQSGREE